MLPATGDEFSRHTARHNQRMTARQTNLPAVRVPAQHQLKSLIGGLGKSLRTVRKQDRAVIAGDSCSGFGDVMGFVEMGIVDSADPKMPSLALEACRLVQQSRETDSLQRRDHFEKVMIAENREPRLGQRGANPLQFSQTRPVISIHAVPKISRKNRRIVWRGASELFDHRRQFHVQIAMKIAELE